MNMFRFRVLARKSLEAKNAPQMAIVYYKAELVNQHQDMTRKTTF